MLVVVLTMGGCPHEDAEPKLVNVVPPPAVARPAPVVLAPPAVDGLEVREQALLCQTSGAVETCRTLARDGHGGYRAEMRSSRVDHVTDDGVACTLQGATLTCGGAAETVEVRLTGHFVYLVAGDRVRWFEPAVTPCGPADDKPLTLHTLALRPSMMSASYRTGCAIVAGAASCWSDPARPVALAAPEPLVEIQTQDTFTVCALGASGKVYCAPPPVLPAELACNMTDLRCGRSAVGDPALHAPFDPLALLRKPLTDIHVPFAVAHLARDDDFQYGICMDDHLHMQAARAGGCAVSADGAVACYSPIDRGWAVSVIAGLPAVTTVYAGRGTDYGLTAAGALYAWDNPGESSAAQIAAHALSLSLVADVTRPLFVISGPSTKDRVRCSLTRSHAVQCWRADGPFAPFTL